MESQRERAALAQRSRGWAQDHRLQLDPPFHMPLPSPLVHTHPNTTHAAPCGPHTPPLIPSPPFSNLTCVPGAGGPPGAFCRGKMYPAPGGPGVGLKPMCNGPVRRLPERGGTGAWSQRMGGFEINWGVGEVIPDLEKGLD